MIKNVLSLFVGILALAFPLTAYAKILVTFKPDTFSIYPRASVVVAGTITNTGSTEVFLGQNNLDFNGEHLSPDGSPFNEAPVSLAAGQTWSGNFVKVTADSEVLPASFVGRFTLLGGKDLEARDLLSTTPFTINVEPHSVTTKPSSKLFIFSTIAILGAGLFLFRHKLRRTSRQ